MPNWHTPGVRRYWPPLAFNTRRNACGRFSHNIRVIHMKNAFQIVKIALLASLLTAIPVVTYAQENNAPEETQETAENAWTEADLMNEVQTQNWSKTVQIADALLKSDPENIKYLSILGAALAQTDENERAEKIFTDLLQKMPDNPEMTTNLCYSQMKLKREAAVETCLKAASMNPEKAEVLNITAIALENNNKLKEARQYYHKIWELDNSNLSALTSATSIDFNLKDYQAAYDLTKQAIDMGRNVPILYLNAMLALSKLGKYEENIQLAEDGYAKFKDDMMLFYKADALFQLGRMDEAEKLFAELEQRSSSGSLNWPRIELSYTQLLYLKGCDLKQANTCQLENEDSCCKNERDALEKINGIKDNKLLKNEPRLAVILACAQAINGDLKTAESTLSQALPKTEDKSEIQAALGVVLYMFGDKRDQEAGMNYLNQAKSANQDFASRETVQKKYLWPPRMLDTLQLMLDTPATDENQSKSAKSGCSCDMNRTGHPMSLMTILAFLLTILAGLGLRRQSH